MVMWEQWGFPIIGLILENPRKKLADSEYSYDQDTIFDDLLVTLRYDSSQLTKYDLVKAW